MQSSLLGRVTGVTGNRSKRHTKFRLRRLQQPPTESTTRLASLDDAQPIEETKSHEQFEQIATQGLSEAFGDDNAGGAQPAPAPNEGDAPTVAELQHASNDRVDDGTSGSGTVSGWKLAAVLIGLSLAVFCMSLVRPGTNHILRIKDVL